MTTRIVTNQPTTLTSNKPQSDRSVPLRLGSDTQNMRERQGNSPCYEYTCTTSSPICVSVALSKWPGSPFGTPLGDIP